MNEDSDAQSSADEDLIFESFDPEEERERVPSGKEPTGPLGSRPSPLLWGGLAVMVLLAALSAFLWVQNRAAAATVETLTTRVPQLLLPLGISNPLAAQLADIRQQAASGSFTSARERAAALSLPPGLRPAAPQPDELPPEGPEITEEMARFFKDHPELEQRLTGYVELARKLRDEGKEVEPLRDLRTRILEAAQQQDAEQVGTLLDEFALGLRDLGAKVLAFEMQQVLAQFQEAFERARKANRDPSKGVKLIRQAEKAVEAGDRERALELARQALAAMKEAPPLKPRVSRQPAGLPSGAAGQVLGMTLGLMGREERDLARAYAAIQEALRADREQNQEQVAEILGQALGSLRLIQGRRQAFGQELQRMEGAGSEQQPTEAVAAPEPSAQPRSPVERIARLLDEVRGIPEEEYTQARPRVAQGLIAMILSLGQPAPAPVAPGEPQSPEQYQAALRAEQRIREKLRIAHQPYLALKEQGEDTTALEELLEGARQALYEGRLLTAESKADAVLRRLGMLPAEPAMPPGRPLTLEREEPRPAPAPPVLPLGE